MFASLGDNITPPQQAFNWICDVYGSTEEVKANGQVIVGLVHGDVGHLGIFVSGKVAKKEHTQIVEVLRYVETLPPGLYAMKIDERRGARIKPLAAAREAEAAVASVPPPPRTKPTRASNGRGR